MAVTPGSMIVDILNSWMGGRFVFASCLGEFARVEAIFGDESVSDDESCDLIFCCLCREVYLVRIACESFLTVDRDGKLDTLFSFG